MKLITFAVPCYNSAAYMEHCIDTILESGQEEDIEIILVNDGSKDNTGEIADRYAAAHPDIVRVIHQENGGHGEGVNQGLRNAHGMYYKVIDSDDWVDVPAMKRVLRQLSVLAQGEKPLDMMIVNYVYEHVEDNSQYTMQYKNVFPEGQVFTWNDVKHFRISQYMMMHSVIYRTQLLRDCNLVLPKHTFYVDNIFVYQPLPHVETIYYMNEDVYRYFIGRADQSVNEKVMLTRIDQQLRVTKIILDCHKLEDVKKTYPKLEKYMFRYVSMMMAISTILLMMDGSKEALKTRDGLWAYVKELDPALYRKMRTLSLNAPLRLPGPPGRKICISAYRLARKIYKFS
jgi:glycosyltransferase involved in cell wall biosynthesis